MRAFRAFQQIQGLKALVRLETKWVLLLSTIVIFDQQISGYLAYKITSPETWPRSFVMNTKCFILALPNQFYLHFKYRNGNYLPMATNTTTDNRAMYMAFDTLTSLDVSTSLVEEHNQNKMEL